MNNQAISKFQMKSFKTRRFNYAVPVGKPISDCSIQHDFVGKYAISYSDSRWLGIIMIYYSAKDHDESDPFSVEIVMDGHYECDAENTPESREQFKRILTMNGAVALITMIRGQVATASTALGLSPALIVPSVNLNHFNWEEQVISEDQS